jgi:hypothetical protein
LKRIQDVKASGEKFLYAFIDLYRGESFRDAARGIYESKRNPGTDIKEE